MEEFNVLKPKEKLFYLQEIIHSCELSTNEIAVYTTLIVFANNKTGKCYPSRKVIADRVNLSVRSVARIIAQLKERGLIEVKKGTNGKSNEYMFLHYSEIGTVLCEGEMDDIGEEVLGCHDCPTKEDLDDTGVGRSYGTLYKDKEIDNNYKDKIQTYDEYGYSQDDYDSIFGNIVN